MRLFSLVSLFFIVTLIMAVHANPMVKRDASEVSNKVSENNGADAQANDAPNDTATTTRSGSRRRNFYRKFNKK